MRFMVATASTGYCPAADFGRQHDRVGAFEDGGRDVGHFGPRGHRAGDHRFEHLGRDHHRLAGAARQRASSASARRAPSRAASRRRDRRAPPSGRRTDPRISSSRCTACGFSILAITAARPRVIFLASAISSGRWTKDSATQSTPASSAASRSERSLGVERRERDHGVGQAHALAVRQLAADLDAGDDARRRRPRSRPGAPCRRRAAGHGPASAAAKISGCGSSTRVASPGVGSGIEREGRRRSASIDRRLPRTCRRRSFGPCRSTRMPIGRAVFGLDRADRRAPARACARARCGSC